MAIDDLEPVDLARRGRYRRAEETGSLQGQQPNQEQCDIKGAEQGVIVPYKLPPGTETATGVGAIISELRAIARMLDEHRRLFTNIETYLTYKSPTGSWFEERFQTTASTPTKPATADTITINTTPGYNAIEVNNRLQGRNAQKLWIVNDGPDNLFVLTSNNGRSFSPEFLMISGEIRIISDVYEFRVRSPNLQSDGVTPLATTSFTSLRASEREVIPPYVTAITNTFPISGASNKSSFIAQNITVNLVDSILPSLVIPDGFSLAVRANVNNIAGSQVYISRTNATTVAARATLNVGDTTRLFITNANLIHVAGSQNGLTVDLLVEQS